MKWPWVSRWRLDQADKSVDHYRKLTDHWISRSNSNEAWAFRMYDETRKAHKGIARLKRRLKRFQVK